MDNTSEYDEYLCSACKKAIKNQVVKCKACPKRFYHPGCVSKHKVFDRNRDLVPCGGPFEKFVAEETEVAKTTTTPVGGSRDRLGSTGSNTSEAKIDWMLKTVREIKDEMACKTEIKVMIQEIVQAEVEPLKQEIEELKRIVQAAIGSTGDAKGSYSSAVKERKKETVIIVKPNVQQESEATKKMIKEKVDIKHMAVGVTKLKKGSNGTVILGCETGGEINTLKAAVQEKMGENFKVTESTQSKPKIKVVNIEEEELKLADDDLVGIIKTQNGMEASEGREMKIVKRLVKGNDQERNKRGRGEGSIIVEVDERTHDELLSRGKLSVGWKKCPVYNHVSVKRCYKCWGYYHIAKNCSREETCYKCAGNHNAKDCLSLANKCINCMFKNKAYNLKINVEHSAIDQSCPTYKRAMEEEKRRAGWQE